MAAILIAVISSIGLLVGGVGVMNIMLMSVTQRTREIGIRMALGAPRTNVLRLFVMQAMKVILSGLAIGVVGALLGSRLIETLLFSTPPHDPPTFASVALIFFAVALLASYIPARRVTKVSPLIALRSE
jgi:putative ABC transport system permease protein